MLGLSGVHRSRPFLGEAVFESRILPSKQSLVRVTSVRIVILACTLFIIYGVIIVYVFLKRDEYPIYNRSPYLILLGALGKTNFIF